MQLCTVWTVAGKLSSCILCEAELSKLMCGMTSLAELTASDAADHNMVDVTARLSSSSEGTAGCFAV